MSLNEVKGIGPAKKKLLEKMQILSIEDLVNHFPKSYTDLNNIQDICSQTESGMVLVKAEMITNVESKISPKNVRYCTANFVSNNHIFQVLWFNNPYVRNILKEGNTYLCFGKTEKNFGKITMINPIFEDVENVKTLQGMLPNYPLTEGLKQAELRTIIKNTLQGFTPNSVIPSIVENQLGLIPIEKAYRNIHFPQNYGQIELSKQRIAIEEVVQLSFALKFSGASQNIQRTNRYKENLDKVKEFICSLPFELTESQKTAVSEIIRGFSSDNNVNALLQGDVGSGKTIVVFLAMYYAYLSGYQSALMVPTEILANQHFQNARSLFEKVGVKVTFLSSAITQKQKNEIKDQIEKGEVDFIIGTHSLIMNDLKFKNLSLVITDEQHRFSVSQRGALCSNNCDSIVMSATPIPRTLALVVYGDMQLIELHDKPKNRITIKTGLVPDYKIDSMYGFIKEEIQNGNQIYFVCAKIDDDDESQLISVEKLYNDLKKKHLKNYRIAYLHGDMKKEEKQVVMEEFNQKKYDCIVSTTVIEVGVDVKDATVIVVFDADRFGLTQLHQLRGRVGRSDKQSYCFLVSQTKNESSLKRLDVFVKTQDGFDIAEKDFNLRGAGDMLGETQHGFVNPVFKKLTIDGKVLKKTKELKEILSNMENYEKYFYLHANKIYKNQLKITL